MIELIVAGALGAAWLALRRIPEAPIARVLQGWLVDRPARKLVGIERRHLIFVLIALVSAQTLMAIGLPDIGFVVAWDVSTYLDIVVVTWTLAAVTNIKAASRIAAQRIQLLTGHRSKPQPRSKRPARRQEMKPSANDDDHPAWALAA